jgi:DNA-binding CsgD family transcriptional regulator
MAKSGELRICDIRDAYRLIGDCRDLGSDPVLWQGRMLEGLVRLLGARAASAGEGRWRRPAESPSPASALSVGFDDQTRERFRAYVRTHPTRTDDLIMKRLGNVPGPLVVRTRSQLVTDAEWYRTRLFNDYLRPSHLNHQLLSVCQVSKDHAISVVGLYRGPGERDFSERERGLLRFFHGELGRLIGTTLVSVFDPDPLHLPRRERQTLACLLEGDSEKQVAARLDVSHATAHQYVMSLYRRFRVRSRAELLAYFLRRQPVRPGAATERRIPSVHLDRGWVLSKKSIDESRCRQTRRL